MANTKCVQILVNPNLRIESSTCLDDPRASSDGRTTGRVGLPSTSYSGYHENVCFRRTFESIPTIVI